jgi:hypothetical protein
MVRAKTAKTRSSGNAKKKGHAPADKRSEMAEMIQRILAPYRRYAVPIPELRKDVDREMGAKTLTEELDLMREGR